MLKFVGIAAFIIGAICSFYIKEARKNGKPTRNPAIVLIICIVIFLSVNFIRSNNAPEPEPATNVADEADTAVSQDTHQKVSIDFGKLNEMTKKDFQNSQTYSLVRDTDFSLQNNNNDKTISLTAIVGDSISEQNLLSLADSMLRSYGFHASELYDFSGPSKNSYGGIFDKYDAFVIIVPASDSKKNYVYKSIPAGAQMNVKIKPDKDFYER